MKKHKKKEPVWEQLEKIQEEHGRKIFERLSMKFKGVSSQETP